MNHLASLNQANAQRAARAYAVAKAGMAHAPIIAQVRASRLTGKELLHILTPMRHCVEQARKGCLTEQQWVVLSTAQNVSRAIEDQGVVRGFSLQLDASHDALQAIENRSTLRETRPWHSPTLRSEELAAVRELASLHAFQLKQLSYGEYQNAFALAVARVRSSGGQVDVGDTHAHAGLPTPTPPTHTATTVDP